MKRCTEIDVNNNNNNNDNDKMLKKMYWKNNWSLDELL